MKLIDLDPHWYTMDESPDIVGITFNCPCPICSKGEDFGIRIGVLFKEEIDRDGLPNKIHWSRKGQKWHREGDSFDTLTITPSVDASKFGHWHGFITNGEIK